MQFHVIILLETRAMAVSILPKYVRFQLPASRPGARGEGLCVLVHSAVAHGVRLWHSSSSSSALWVILISAVTGLARDIYIAAVYVPPARSALLRTISADDCFTDLIEAASAASNLRVCPPAWGTSMRASQTRQDADLHAST